jgi:hypothetical protein
LEQIEGSIAKSLATRAAAAGDEPDEFHALLIARVSVAVLRQALLQIRDEGDTKPGRLAVLLRRGFATVREI